MKRFDNISDFAAELIEVMPDCKIEYSDNRCWVVQELQGKKLTIGLISEQTQYGHEIIMSRDFEFYKVYTQILLNKGFTVRFTNKFENKNTFGPPLFFHKN